MRDLLLAIWRMIGTDEWQHGMAAAVLLIAAWNSTTYLFTAFCALAFAWTLTRAATIERRRVQISAPQEILLPGGHAPTP